LIKQKNSKFWNKTRTRCQTKTNEQGKIFIKADKGEYEISENFFKKKTIRPGDEDEKIVVWE